MKLEVFVVLDPDTGKPFCTNQNTLFNCASGVEEVSIRFAGRFGLGAAATRKLVIKMTPKARAPSKGMPVLPGQDRIKAIWPWRYLVTKRMRRHTSVSMRPTRRLSL